MPRVKGRVYVVPVGMMKPSKVLTAWWLDAPKDERAKEAMSVVRKWAKGDKYRGCQVFVEEATLTEGGQDGRGRLNVNGRLVAHFTAQAVPDESAQTASLFGGGR